MNSRIIFLTWYWDTPKPKKKPCSSVILKRDLYIGIFIACGATLYIEVSIVFIEDLGFIFKIKNMDWIVKPQNIKQYKI